MQSAPPPARRPDGTIMPGHSGNLSGRPKVVGEIQKIAREAAPAAFAKVVTLVENADPRVALAAAQEILNRAFGKPMQQVQSEVTKIDYSAMYLAALKEVNGIIRASDAAKVIEGVTDETENAEAAASDEQVRQGGTADPPVNW
jgi:hypothetical protein